MEVIERKENKVFVLELSGRELNALMGGMRETMEAWQPDFDIRTGFSKPEFKEISKSMHGVILRCKELQATRTASD